MALPFLLCHRLPFPEFETLGGAGGYTGGFQSLIDPILAIIALDHFAEFWLPLRCTPGACGNAGFATDTEIMLHKNNPVTGSLLHGAGGTGGDAPGIFAMKTEHKDEGGPRQTADHFRPDLDNLA
jgi:hypothetical protein